MKHDHGGIEKQKQGITSFNMQNPDLVFKELDIKQGDTFLDIGCGAGDYSFQASKFVGDAGLVYGLEQWEELVSKLNQKVTSQNIKNMRIILADMTEKLPLPDESVDICLIAMVVHGFKKEDFKCFDEIQRILKPDGRLAIIERKKDESIKEPPMNFRLSAQEIDDLLVKYKFKQIKYADLGDNYIVQFGID